MLEPKEAKQTPNEVNQMSDDANQMLNGARKMPSETNSSWFIEYKLEVITEQCSAFDVKLTVGINVGFFFH